MTVPGADVPAPLAQTLAYLRTLRNCEVRVDAIKDNFAYVWVADIAKANSSESPGGWLRLPLAFPHANPHGFVTREALKNACGASVTDGYNPGHDTCAPVGSFGGAHYYSWTWENCPALSRPEDIAGVVQWYERRIRKG